MVWDLDDTLWDGVLLESDEVELKPVIREVLETLDTRGVLHSIASRNHPDDAQRALRRFGIDHFFLYPEIGWGAKSASIGRIAGNLNIGLDAMMFVDDDPYERDEVHAVHPAVRCVEAEAAAALCDLPCLRPAARTEDARQRRQMYAAEAERRKAEAAHRGARVGFLKSLGMHLTIAPAESRDLDRAVELTERTNQLNSMGRTYSRAELEDLLASDNHDVLMAELRDRYGPYGKIALALVERGSGARSIRLLLTSCRVVSRGVGTILLSHILQEAGAAGERVTVDFTHTGRNRMMYAMLKLAGFADTGSGVLEISGDLSQVQGYPDNVEVTVLGDKAGRRATS